jgi:stage II sporulation protein D
MPQQAYGTGGVLGSLDRAAIGSWWGLAIAATLFGMLLDPSARRRRRAGTGRLAVTVLLSVAIGTAAQAVAPIASRAATTLGSSVTFYGRGYGHGVGMSQYGAAGRATAGQSRATILAHYYQGTTLASISPTTPVRVLVLSNWTASASVPLTIRGNLGNWTIDGQTATFPASAQLTAAPPPSGSTAWQLVVKSSTGTVLLNITVTTGFRVRPADSTTRIQLVSKPTYYDTYRGVLRVILGSTTATVINEVGLDDYLKGVVPSEMSYGWPTEALASQAIASRSYATYQLHPSSGSYDLYDDTRSQVYHGSLGEQSTTNAVVASTSGVILKSGTALVDAVYHSGDGGATENNENVFTSSTGALGTPYSYLRGSSDLNGSGKSYDAASPYETWNTATYTVSQLSTIFGADSRTAVGTLSALDLSHRGVSGRLIYVILYGSGGSKQISGTLFTSIFNSHKPSADAAMRSTWFDVAAVVTDSTPPTVSAPQSGPDFVTTLGTTTVPIRTTWSATDPSGIASYNLQLQANGGSWSGVTLASATTTSIYQSLTFGTTYRYQVRATDAVGNTSAFVPGPTFKPSVTDQTSSAVKVVSGSWSTQSNSSAYGGSLIYTTTSGSSASFTFTGQSVAWVAYRGPDRGSASVYLDGVFYRTISEYASTYSARQILYAAHWGANGTHTIKIVNLATSGHPRVDVDAFVWLVVS